MNTQDKNILSLLCILPMLGSGLTHAAAIFDPDAVTTTLATQPVSYVGAPSASGYNLTAGQNAYIIDYSSANWSGDMHSYTLSSSGVLSNVDNWDGGAKGNVDLQNYDTDRYIVTMSGTSKIPFRWSSLNSTQQAALDSTTSTSATTSPVLNFIRGDRSNETPNGLKYRARASALGDIIHSTPRYWDDGTNKSVFVGANDGMLHAFDAISGAERFAYIPSVLISKLPNLKTDPYAHKYFVDGQIAIRKYGSQSILAGTLGGGGKGLFALDVSAIPTSETDAANKILWEITNATSGFANLGNAYGTPILTTLPDGTAALLVANGYNNTGNGHATLYIINPVTGAKISEIDTGSGTTSSPDGLSSPTIIDTNFDGKADYAYAGDIDGNLWKFDLAAKTVTKLYTTSPAQAITMAPGYKAHPNGGYMITFATGRNFIAADDADTSTFYAYGIWDRPSAYATNSVLLSQTLTESNYTSVTPNIRVRTATSNQPDWSAGSTHNMGWRTPLPIGGERMVGDGAFVTSGVFLFMSTNPTINPTATPPGDNWWMQLNALTGGDNATVLFDLNGDAAFTSADQVSTKSPVGRDMGGGVRSQLTAFATSGFDVYIANYDKNGDPPPPPASTSSSATVGVAGGHFDVDNYSDPYLTKTDTPTASSACSSGHYCPNLHVHQYDKLYDKTGLNMLNASDTRYNLSQAIPLTSTKFKVLASNQYLNPAVNIHINGTPSYVWNIDQGYIPIKNFMTMAALDVTTIPTYTRTSVNSLAINMPQDAFSPKDWWGGALGLPADVRVGLQPTKYSCANTNAGSYDGNMFQPVNPPATVTADGNGTLGYSKKTSEMTATGARHNGALTIQVIKDTTPQDDIEMSIPNHPEYGWRIKSAKYSTDVLEEYIIYWHHPNGICYGHTGWSKLAPTDTTGSNTQLSTPAVGSTDPKIGNLAGVAAVPGTTTSTVTNADGTTTTTTTTIVVNADGTVTTTTTITNSNGSSSSSTSTSTGIAVGGVVSSTGTIGGGVTTPTEAIGRVNWRELLQ